MEWMASEEKDGSVNSSVAQAIDSSASLEIDQPTESTMSSGKKVDKNSEVSLQAIAFFSLGENNWIQNGGSRKIFSILSRWQIGRAHV